MPTSNQQPLTAKRGGDPHDFTLGIVDWEAAVFDSAAYFNVIDYAHRPFRVTECETFAEAAATATDTCCVYAVTKQGRSVLLDREKWPEWGERASSRTRY